MTNPDGSVAGLETDQFTIENGVLSATYNDPTVTLTITPEGSAPVSSDYIYIGQWGIKVRKPEAKHVAFECNVHGEDYCVIYGSNKDGVVFDENNGDSILLTIVRSAKGTARTEQASELATPVLLAIVGEYDYAGIVSGAGGSNDQMLSESFLDYFHNRNGALYFSSI